MNLTSPQPPARSTQQADRGQQTPGAAGPSDVRPPVDVALRATFERALARQQKPGQDEETQPQPASAVEVQPAAAASAAWATWQAAAQDRHRSPDPDALVFVSSQPVPATPHHAAAQSGSTSPTAHQPAEARPTSAALGAALSALRMPASPDGLQHWQFSFSQPGSLVSGVSLTAQPDMPWQLQVNLLAQAQAHGHLPNQARERSALDARLGELRQRLLGRGALIGDIELHDPPDNPHHR